MLTVLITLTTAGADTGNFNLYSNVDGYVSAFATGVSKAALEAGYTSYVVPNGTTTIRVMSSTVCTNYIDIIILVEPTTTTTTTSTPTTTTTTTTTFGIQATIEFLFYNNGIGNIYAQANVTSGVTLDNLGFNLTAATGYQSSGCTGTSFAGNSLFVLNAGLSTSQDNIVGFNGNSILSAQVDVSGLQVAGNLINTVSETIVVGGNVYLITGATNCFETP